MPVDTSTTNSTATTTDTTETETTSEVEKPMTAEQFNKALSSRERAFEKRLAAQQSKFEELIGRLAPPPKEEKELSRTAELEKTVKELSKNLQERDARDKAMSLRQTAEQALLSHGIDAEFRDHALAYLVDHKQAIRYDSDGQIVMVVNGVEYDDLDAGMAVWANSRDAKLYKKASGAAGSGDRNRTGSADTNNPANTLELKRREDWQKSGEQKLTLTRESKANLQSLLAKKLSGK